MLSEMSRFWRRLTNKLCCMRDDDEEVTEMVIVSLRSRYEVSLGGVLTEMHRGSLLAFRRTMWLLRTVFSRWLLRLLFEGGRCSIDTTSTYVFFFHHVLMSFSTDTILQDKSTHPTLAKEITAQARSNQRMQVKVGGGRSGRSNATEILDDVKMIVREGDDRQPQPLTKKHTLCHPRSTILL